MFYMFVTGTIFELVFLVKLLSDDSERHFRAGLTGLS